MLNKLYNMARAIPKELELINKYTWLGVNNILPVKYLDMNDVMTQPDLPIASYVTQNEAVLLFPNIINGNIVDMFVKPVYNKAVPLKLGSRTFPYNVGRLQPDFKYGDPIILVEGVTDAAALMLMTNKYNIIVMQSSKINKAHIEFLHYLTNNIIIIPDNDDAGKTGFTRMWYDFKALGVNVVSVDQFRYFKDTGDFLDKIVYYYKTEDHESLDEIQLVWQYYMTAIDMEIKNMK